MHKLRRISRLFVGTLIIAVAFIASVEGSSHKRKARPARHDRLFRKLGINKLTQPTAAPDFTLRDLNGNSVSLSNFRGNVVFLNFWATWCPPCRSEMPSMDRLYGQLRGRGFVVLAVDKQENRRQVEKFMKHYGLSFPALLDTDGKVSSLYGIRGLPSTFIIDSGGKIIGSKMGPKDWATPDVVAFFKSLLKDDEVSGSSVVSVPTIPLPSLLSVKSMEVHVYAQQNKYSEEVVQLERGEKLTPLAKAFGEGEAWYLVRTQKGAVGWVRSSGVAELTEKER